MVELPLILAGLDAHAAEPPPVASDRYQLELIASEPNIVTPIGVAFDRRGRLLVVESHTHRRTADYKGPPGDRIRMLFDADGDGRLDHWATFAEGFKHAMNLLVRPDGAVYLVTRHNVVLLRDKDDDGRADEQTVLLRLETKDDYPHNALAGFARLPSSGELLIGMGENHGAPYKLIGADGKTLAGKDGAGCVFRCSQDGRNLQRVATGFWNPFGLCVLDDGRIFAVDNDPDACPPCRLLHVVPGGDYGFRYQYGRAGNHPLQAWNGELPGTLPMVCGVGEAPTAIVAHAGSLWVTSWGDHRIERYRLIPQGGSYSAQREIIVQGGDDFRPTGMAVAPDGSLYFGDWRRRDYEVHGTGRLWRLVLPKDEISETFPPRSAQDTGLHATKLQQLRLVGLADPVPVLRAALASPSADERLFAVRWIADERIAALRDDVAILLDGPLPNARYYLAVLAAVDWLNREPELRDSGINDALLVQELQSERRPPAVHALALRLLSPDDKFLTADHLRRYLQSEYEPLRLEAVRTLAQQSNFDRFGLLESTARDTAQSDAVRVEALVGLTAAADHARELLEGFAVDANPELRREAERMLRLARLRPMPVEAKPPADDLAAWNHLLAEPGDAEAGRRLFFSPLGPRCSVCHQYDGRGGRTGPDITQFGRSSSRARIIASILQPSQEIAPHYQPWVLVTKDGKTYSGLRLAKAGDDGVEPYVDSEGHEFSLNSDDVESRSASTASIMPGGLETTLSIADLRDLVSFLAMPNDAGK